MLSGGGNEDMGTLLALMHSAPCNALTLKLSILKVIYIQLYAFPIVINLIF